MNEQRWTEQRGREVVRAWRKSGQSMSAFARKHGWNVQRMAYWRDRVDEADMAGVERAPGRFLPAVVVNSPASPACRARIVFPSGVTIEVEQIGEIAPDWVAALEVALGTRP